MTFINYINALFFDLNDFGRRSKWLCAVTFQAKYKKSGYTQLRSDYLNVWQ